jgi:hypothetical protein
MTAWFDGYNNNHVNLMKFLYEQNHMFQNYIWFNGNQVRWNDDNMWNLLFDNGNWIITQINLLKDLKIINNQTWQKYRSIVLNGMKNRKKIYG